MSMLNQSVDEPVECPLCMEPLEVDDLSFFPCTCGYQICRFCWHRIRTDENGLCPACRKPYAEDPADFKPLSKEDVARMKAEKKQKNQQKKQKITENRKSLANVRVVQRNLIFVLGLPNRLADVEILKRHEYFGKYGKIMKVVVNQNSGYVGTQVPTISAYVTYQRSEDALRAIQAVNNISIDGRVLKSSLGTTKYCSLFLKNLPCTKPDCMYLHDMGDPEASFTKEEMQQGKHQEFERKLHEQLILQQQQQPQPSSRKQTSSPPCRSLSPFPGSTGPIQITGTCNGYSNRSSPVDSLSNSSTSSSSPVSSHQVQLDAGFGSDKLTESVIVTNSNYLETATSSADQPPCSTSSSNTGNTNNRTYVCTNSKQKSKQSKKQRQVRQQQQTNNSSGGSSSNGGNTTATANNGTNSNTNQPRRQCSNNRKRKEDNGNTGNNGTNACGQTSHSERKANKRATEKESSETNIIPCGLQGDVKKSDQNSPPAPPGIPHLEQSTVRSEEKPHVQIAASLSRVPPGIPTLYDPRSEDDTSFFSSSNCLNVAVGAITPTEIDNSEWLLNEEPQISDVLPPVSTSEDWEAAFGFGSVPRNLIEEPVQKSNDELDFDPFAETQRALSEIIDREQEFRFFTPAYNHNANNQLNSVTAGYKRPMTNAQQNNRIQDCTKLLNDLRIGHHNINARTSMPPPGFPTLNHVNGVNTSIPRTGNRALPFVQQPQVSSRHHNFNWASLDHSAINSMTQHRNDLFTAAAPPPPGFPMVFNHYI